MVDTSVVSSVTYKDTESLGCTPETSVKLGVNYTQITTFKIS